MLPQMSQSGCHNPSTGEVGQCQATVTVLDSSGQLLGTSLLENTQWQDFSKCPQNRYVDSYPPFICQHGHLPALVIEVDNLRILSCVLATADYIVGFRTRLFLTSR